MSSRRTPAGIAATLFLALTLATTVSGCSEDAPAEKASDVVTPATVEENAAAIDALIATGIEQIGQEDYNGARDTFNNVLALDPKNTYAIYNLGYAAQQQGNAAGAITQYVSALEIDGDFVPALYNLAILTETSDLQAAVALYRHVLSVQPDDAAATMRLGFALEHLGQTKEGRELIEHGIELDPAMADVEAPAYD